MKDVLREALRTVLNPKSVAVIGASENENKIGGRPLLYLSRHGYKGKVFPINPKRAVKTAVVMTSGFGETDPVGGKAKEKRMRDAAHAAGMRIVGPNSQGLAN